MSLHVTPAQYQESRTAVATMLAEDMKTPVKSEGKLDYLTARALGWSNHQRLKAVLDSHTDPDQVWGLTVAHFNRRGESNVTQQVLANEAAAEAAARNAYYTFGLSFLATEHDYFLGTLMVCVGTHQHLTDATKRWRAICDDTALTDLAAVVRSQYDVAGDFLVSVQPMALPVVGQTLPDTDAASFELRYAAKELGTPLENHLHTEATAEAAWDWVVETVTTSMNNLDLWPAFLRDALNAGLNGAFCINTGPDADAVAKNADPAECREYCETLLGDHNMVGWWLDNNTDDDQIQVRQQAGDWTSPLELIYEHGACELDAFDMADEDEQRFFY